MLKVKERAKLMLASAFLLTLIASVVSFSPQLSFSQYPQPGQALPAAMGKTTLAAAITSTSQTVIQLTTTTITVGPLLTVTARNPQWAIAVDSEIMAVNNVNGNYVTVTRGSFGTLAKIHGLGQTVWAAPANLFPNNKPRPMTAATKFRFATVDVGSVAYASLGTNTTNTIALYCADLTVDGDFIATGIGVLNGATVTTDKGMVALYGVSGVLLAQSTTAGASHVGANAFQDYAFVPGKVYIPRGEYYACYQPNGTTDTFHTIAASTFLNVLTEKLTAGTFGTIPATITIPTTFTADVGPISYIY